MTILLMAGATLCVGLVPSYAAIGFWAPVLMVLLRMIQGFSTGGEYGGAATFMAEYAPGRRRGFFGSFLEFGTFAGFSLGALLMLGVLVGAQRRPDERLGLAAAVPGRRPARPGRRLPAVRGWKTPRCSASWRRPARRRSDTATQFKDLLAGYWRPILRLGGLVVALNVVNYTLLSYMPTYLRESIGLSSNMSLLVPIIGMLAMMVFLPFAGGCRIVLGANRCGGSRWSACSSPACRCSC